MAHSSHSPPGLVAVILPPGSFGPKHALHKLGTLEYRFFRGSLRYMRGLSLNRTVWERREAAFENAARMAAPRGVIKDWSLITGKKTYFQSVREIGTQVQNSRYFESFRKKGAQEAYNRLVKGSEKIIEYREKDLLRFGGGDEGHINALQAWKDVDIQLKGELSAEELAAGFAEDGSVLTAEALGVEGEIAEIIDFLAIIFI